jgi:hypothetical protein
MNSTQSCGNDLISSHADMRSDLENALRIMSNYPPEQRTATLLICLMRNSDARSSLSSLIGTDQ